MTRNFRRFLLGLNYTGLVVMALLWIAGKTLAPMDCSMRVTELHRAKVFNEQNLTKYDPNLGASLRFVLGPWIASSAFQWAGGMMLVAIPVLAMNVVSLHWSGRSKPQKKSNGWQKK